jgi:putative cell wall-binding protein/Tol biopolymer transport system component
MGRRPLLGAVVLAAAVLGTTLVGGGGAAAAPAMATATPTVSRLAGADRIGTAVKISQHAFPSAFTTGGSVYLARMDVFADAVAAGTLTDGPVLLVPSCASVPQVVKDELTRLTPARVVALGGAGAVCDQVLNDAAAGRPTARLEGADRYLTSLAIARERIRQAPATEVYVASGLDSPDAVVGGQLTRGPILLTGTVDRSADYNAFINEVKPTRVVAVGGPGAVSEAQLNALAGWKARLAGQSRYETAAAIAMREFPEDATTVYLARGDLYADAVAAGALKDGPVLLVASCTLPTSARERIAAARPLRIIALGGSGAVCDAVLAQAATAQTASGGRIVASQRDTTGWATDRGSVNAISSNGDWLLVSGYGLIPDTSFGLVLQHRATGEIRAVAGAGTSYAVDTDGARDVSGDGGQVVFETRTPVDAADTNGLEDVVLFDRAAGTWTVVSRTPAGQVGNGPSTDPVISEDGTTVVFTSAATDLVPGDTNNRADVFAVQLSTGRVTLVSRTAEGAPGNDDSRDAAVSGDGRYVVYTTAADNLFPGDTAGTRDLLRVDMTTGAVVRVNRLPACGWCSSVPSISADGTVVAYVWPGDEVPGINAQADNVFVRDVATGDLRLASFAEGTETWSRSGDSPAVSADGSTVAFLTRSRLDLGDDQDSPSLYAYDRATRKVTWLSRPFTGGPATVPGTRIVWAPTITANGSTISVVTDQPQLVSYGNSTTQSYIWERIVAR